MKHVNNEQTSERKSNTASARMVRLACAPSPSYNIQDAASPMLRTILGKH